VKCNQLDLSLFQFDFDLTFAAFFLNADKTIYARYGIRTSREADEDVAVEGLVETMQRVLALHKKYPDNADSLFGKQSPGIDQAVPEDFKSLSEFKPALSYENQVAKSCIHCHQVRDAQRDELRAAKKRLPENLLFPFPPPETIGIKFDPKTASTITEIKEDSFAALAGLKAGDQVILLDRQPIASSADFLWVLDNSVGAVELPLVVLRGDQQVKLTLKLADGWRTGSDISWRPTSWELRRMATGGTLLEAADAAARKQLQIPGDQMALRVKHVGKYGEHARAMNAGVKVDDILVGVDEHHDLLTESAVFAYAMQQKKPGERITFHLLRNGREVTASFVLQ
jgi:hypothetical protein